MSWLTPADVDCAGAHEAWFVVVATPAAHAVTDFALVRAIAAIEIVVLWVTTCRKNEVDCVSDFHDTALSWWTVAFGRCNQRVAFAYVVTIHARCT